MPVRFVNAAGVEIEVEGDRVPTEQEVLGMFASLEKKSPAPEPTPTQNTPEPGASSIFEQPKPQLGASGATGLEEPFGGPKSMVIPPEQEYNVVTQPMLEIPAVNAGLDHPIARGVMQVLAPNMPPETTAAAINTASGLISGMTSIAGTATLAAPAVGKIGRAAIGAAWGVPAVLDLPKASMEAGRLSVEGTKQESANAIVGTAVGNVVLPAVITAGVRADLRANRAPLTAAAIEATAKPKEPNASQISSPTTLHGDVRPLQEPAQVVPVQESGPRVQPQAKGPEVASTEVPLEAKPIGMGGATPEEFIPPPAGPTSIKNAVTDQQRAELGLPPAVEPAKRSFGRVWDSAMQAIDSDPEIQDRLVAQLKQKPRALTDTEDALLLQRQVELQTEYAKAGRDLSQAWEDGRLEDVKLQQERVDHLSDKLLELYDVTKSSGTETGRGLNARRMMANQDFTLASMVTEKRAAKGGAPLTPEETAKVTELSQKIEKTQKALDEQTARIQEKDAVEKIGKGPKEIDFSEEAQARVTDQIRNKVENSDFDISSLVQRLARIFVARGVHERGALIKSVHDVLKTIDPFFTERDTMDAISGYGKFKQLSKDEVSVALRDLKGQMQQVAKLEDIESKKPLQKTGVERRSPSDEERRLIQQVNEAKRKYGVVVTDPATQLKSALQQAKTYLTHRLADLREEIAKRERIVKTKTEIKPDAELQALRAEYEQVKKEHSEIFPPREMTPEQRVAVANKTLDRSIAQLEADLDAGKLKRDSVASKTPETPALLEKRAWLQALREYRKELLDAQKPQLTPEQRSIQSLKSRLETANAEYQRRLREGDFSPRKKTEVDISQDAEAIKLKAENERLKTEYKRGVELDRLRRRTIGQKIYAGFKEALNLPRNILSSWDLSAVLRQGGFISFGNPVRAAKSIVPMLKSLASESAALQLEQQILSRPNAKLYGQSKLYLAPQDAIRLSAQEEQLMSRLASRIPGIRASNRAFVSYLNKLRADSFDAMVDSVGRGRTLKPEEASAIANFINVSTGRGNLGKAAAASETMATIFFSPRLLASRFQLLAGEPLYRGSAATRKAIATEYAKTLVGLGVVYGLAQLAGATLQDDPRSADFGKLKFGDTRVDPLMGLSQVSVLIGRLGSGETMTAKGDVRPIRGEDRPYGGATAPDVIARFLRSKLSPIIGSAVDVVSQENVVGEPVTTGSVAQNMLVPLSFREIQDVMVEQGVPAGVALEILNLLGMGLQHYEEKPKK